MRVFRYSWLAIVAWPPVAMLTLYIVLVFVVLGQMMLFHEVSATPVSDALEWMFLNNWAYCGPGGGVVGELGVSVFAAIGLALLICSHKSTTSRFPGWWVGLLLSAVTILLWCLAVAMSAPWHDPPPMTLDGWLFTMPDTLLVLDEDPDLKSMLYGACRWTALVATFFVPLQSDTGRLGNGRRASCP